MIRPTPDRRLPSLSSLALLAILAAACAPAGPAPGSVPDTTGAPGGGGGTSMPTLPQVDWGVIPPEPRLPGEVPTGLQLPEFDLRNRGTMRRETVAVSLPFAWGQVYDLSGLSVEGEATAWRVLQRWPDQSVRVAQAQFTTTMTANERRRYRVVELAATRTGSFVPHAVFASSLPSFGAEVKDGFGGIYRTFWHQPVETLEESECVRVRRVRGYHNAVNGSGIGRDYLTSTFYLTEFADQPVLVVDWVLGNDYLGADDPKGSIDPNMYPLGSIDVGSASFLQRGSTVTIPYEASRNGIRAPEPASGDYTAYRVMEDTFLGDGQTRRYRFLLYVEDASASVQQRELDRSTAHLMAQAPLRPLATLASWQQTHAIGLLGGPLNPPTDAADRAAAEFYSWNGAGHFGTWGSFGDPKVTGQTGTPRNHPLSPELAHAVQSGDDRLLLMLEQKAWIQSARPYHLYGLRVEDEDDVLLWDGVPLYLGSRDLSHESLGRRAFFGNDPYTNFRQRVLPGSQRAHGFEHFDVEHFTMDLLFDYWTVSGDAWAKEEIRQLGESLRGLLRETKYNTSRPQAIRAEGWTMQSLVQAYLATGDLRFRDHALDRVHFIVNPARPAHTSGAMRFEGSNPRTGYPGQHEFYMPWQHGALFYGYLAAWKFFGDPLLLNICERAARSVEYGWVSGVQDPNRGYVANGLRYYVPVSHQGVPVPPDHFDATVGIHWGDSPLGGAHVLLLGGLMLLADATEDEASRQRALFHGMHLEPGPYGDDDRWSRWHYCVPEHYAR